MGHLVNAFAAKIEGEISVGSHPYEGRSEIFVRKSFTLWRKLENSPQCPRFINFQIPFSAIESRGAGIERLPPSYVCDVGQGGRISCSYSMHVNVTQRSRHAFWHNRNRYALLISLPTVFHPFVFEKQSPLAPSSTFPLFENRLTHFI